MSDDRFQPDLLHSPPPDIVYAGPALPAWLARRLLREGEQITWVRGPRLNPWWERHVTNPVWFLYAVALAAVSLTVGRLCAESWRDTHPLSAVVALALFLGTVFVLALSAAYFTRLVVTNFRVVIVQGYEVCRSWGLDDLPPSLIRYGPRGREGGSRSVDLDALQTLLGGATEQFTDSKTIQALGKHLDRIKRRADGR